VRCLAGMLDNCGVLTRHAAIKHISQHNDECIN
jgi:hypothetical protein